MNYTTDYTTAILIAGFAGIFWESANKTTKVENLHWCFIFRSLAFVFAIVSISLIGLELISFHHKLN